MATTYNPEIIIVGLGTNDNDLADLDTTYATNLNQLKTDHPTASIYCMNILNETTMPHGTRAFKNAKIASAVASVAGTTLWDTEGWIVPATDTVDGYHPNAAGGAKIATQILARI
jgi:lysophospholipase L1-like esterase